MIADNKTRVTITVEKQLWKDVQALMKERGFPTGSLSFYLNCCLDHLDNYLNGGDVSHQMPLFEMEILRTDQAGALFRTRKEDEK